LLFTDNISKLERTLKVGVQGLGQLGMEFLKSAANNPEISEFIINNRDGVTGDGYTPRAINVCNVLKSSTDAKVRIGSKSYIAENADVIFMMADASGAGWRGRISSSKGPDRNDLLNNNIESAILDSKIIGTYGKAGQLIVVCTNPIDIISYYVHSGISQYRSVAGRETDCHVVGANQMDTDRFQLILAGYLKDRDNIEVRSVYPGILGSHDEHMFLLPSLMKVEIKSKGGWVEKTLDSLLEKEEIGDILLRTKKYPMVLRRTIGNWSWDAGSSVGNILTKIREGIPVHLSVPFAYRDNLVYMSLPNDFDGLRPVIKKDFLEELVLPKRRKSQTNMVFFEKVQRLERQFDYLTSRHRELNADKKTRSISKYPKFFKELVIPSLRDKQHYLHFFDYTSPLQTDKLAEVREPLSILRHKTNIDSSLPCGYPSYMEVLSSPDDNHIYICSSAGVQKVDPVNRNIHLYKRPKGNLPDGWHPNSVCRVGDRLIAAAAKGPAELFSLEGSKMIPLSLVAKHSSTPYQGEFRGKISSLDDNLFFCTNDSVYRGRLEGKKVWVEEPYKVPADFRIMNYTICGDASEPVVIVVTRPVSGLDAQAFIFQDSKRSVLYDSRMCTSDANMNDVHVGFINGATSAIICSNRDMVCAPIDSGSPSIPWKAPNDYTIRTVLYDKSGGVLALTHIPKNRRVPNTRYRNMVHWIGDGWTQDCRPLNLEQIEQAQGISNPMAFYSEL